MRRMLFVVLLAACAHLEPAEIQAPDVEEARQAKPILLASADVGTSVRQWYTARLLQQPVDSFAPVFNFLTVVGSSPSTFLGPITAKGLTLTGSAAGTLNANGLTWNPGAGELALTGAGAYFYFNNASAAGGAFLNLVSAANAGATPATAAFKFYPSNALDATDWVFHIGTAANAADLFNVAYNGTVSIPAVVGTAASGTGVTSNYVGAQRGWVAKTTVTNAAMTAAGTTDITIATTPVNSRIIRVTADVTQVFTGGALTAVTVQCGNAAGGTQYLLANSVFTAQNTWGDTAAEVGAGLLTATWADFGTSAAGVPGAITVSCRFTCTTANCNAATQGSVSFYVEGVTY